jgi:crotonobetaine/carnitine-CoA ligase
VNETRTIPRLFRAAVAEHPHKPWLFSVDGVLTYEEAQARIEAGAATLRAMGVTVGDRVVVTARNTGEYLLAWFALMEIGAVQLAVNPKGTAAELAGFVEQGRPVLIVSDDSLRGLVDEATTLARLPIPVVDVARLFDTPGHAQPPADVDPDDVAVLIPTSGTTGRSKLVMQTHRAYVMAGEGFPFWLGLTGDDRLLAALPLFHINALAYSTLGSVAAGASLVLLPGFSASRFLDQTRHFEATQFNSIGAMLEILMRQPVRPDDAENPIRLCYTGPSPDRDRHLDIEARFGFELTCGYGLSETPYGLIWRRGTRPYGSLGSPRQHPRLGHVNDARVLDDDGAAVDVGGIGELELRNPAIMRGYFEMPEETAAVTVDGWLRTGDLVRDNGDETYTFVGRKKDVIRRRGENLSPGEVEAVLQRFPGVVEAAVIAVPSDLGEDDVKAFLTVEENSAVDIGALREFALSELARFKVPRYFEIVDDLPHTPTGRLAKHHLPRDRSSDEIDTEAQR